MDEGNQTRIKDNRIFLPFVGSLCSLLKKKGGFVASG